MATSLAPDRRWRMPEAPARLPDGAIENSRWYRNTVRALYLVAAAVAIRAVIFIPAATEGVDFTPIWRAVVKYTSGAPVYDEDYTTTDPHYLYSPGGTFLLAPIGILPSEETARWVMMALGAASILAALALAARMISARFFRPMLAIAVIGTFAPAEPVVSTLRYTNINGFLLLLMVLFTWVSLSDVPDTFSRRGLFRWRTVASGLLLAVALSIKPHFIVLAVILLISRQLVALVIAGLGTILFFAIGWFTMNTPGDYVDRLLPYLGEPRDYHNGSIAGMAAQLGWAPGVELAIKVVFLAVVAAATVLLLRWREEDPVMWAFSTLAVLISGITMAGGLQQGYYAMWLLPMAVTVFSPKSPMHSAPMWLAYPAFLMDFEWPADGWPLIAEVLRWRTSIGWLALPLIVAVWAILQRRRGHSSRLG